MEERELCREDNMEQIVCLPPYIFQNKKKIIVQAEFGYSLYSIDANNLNSFYQVDLSQFNKYGKYNYTFALGKKDNNNIIFRYGEGYPNLGDWGFISFDSPTVTNVRDYIWNINNNTFTKVDVSQWQNTIDDLYEASDSFRMYPLTEKKINDFKKSYELRKGVTTKRKKKLRRMNKRVWKYGKKFLKLLKKGKIDVGSYSKPSDLSFKPTGGRYMVVRNDKLYLVHMKTKKVYTLMDDPFRDLTYFIIEKNEDDVDLDAE